MESSREVQDPNALTSLHVRRARQGDQLSLEWLVRKFSPLLLESARYRLGRALRELYDPEDIVNDVWGIALPRLSELPSRDERYTPVLLKFLATTLIYRVNGLVAKHIRGKPRKELPAAKGPGAENAESAENQIMDPRTTIVSRLLREEARDAVTAALAKLDERDKELVILRGIDQQPYREIAAQLGRDAKVLAVQYQRALAKLRDLLPGSIFGEMGEE